jgi:hypothetical protein
MSRLGQNAKNGREGGGRKDQHKEKRVGPKKVVVTDETQPS